MFTKVIMRGGGRVSKSKCPNTLSVSFVVTGTVQFVDGKEKS